MDIARTIITKNAKETQKMGEDLAHKLDDVHILCLYGELGSGKTAFTQGFAKGVGIAARLLSPTFIIVRRYEIPHVHRQLYHIDLYRVHESPKMNDLGLSEIFSDPTALVILEWAERLGTELPKKRIDITFHHREGDVREIRITHHG